MKHIYQISHFGKPFIGLGIKDNFDCLYITDLQQDNIIGTSFDYSSNK